MIDAGEATSRTGFLRSLVEVIGAPPMHGMAR